ncbi:MAG: NRDE family protein [Deltaproteobacteria bacterium]|nr:NRDE family protein [Deltaproteobacteria bacterium]
MCTLSLYFREFDGYPLVVAANRDEYYARPSAAPQVLSTGPLIFGGRDVQAGGTWLGVNEHGLLVAILNRRIDATDDRFNKRSRGLLCLEVLNTQDPNRALAILEREPAHAYLPFNLLVSNDESAYVAYNEADGIGIVPLDHGLHVLSNTSVFDPRSEKMDTAYGLFLTAGQQAWENPDLFFRDRPLPNRAPAEGKPPCLTAFAQALASHRMHGAGADPRGAICVHAERYGTVSSSIIVLAGREKRFDYYHAPGAPCRSSFEKCASPEIR